MMPAPVPPAAVRPADAASVRARGRALGTSAAVALLLVLAALPLVARAYVLYLVMQIAILALFALGFNLLFGYTGLLSFGQAGFFAVGAYACAKILLRVPSLPLGILGGAAAAGVAAAALGLLSVRHTRIYFSMLTLAFGMMIFSIAWKWRAVTGGDDGLVGVPRAPVGLPGLVLLDVSTLDRYYYVVLVVAAVATYGLWRLVQSPLGLALRAIRDSESRAAFAGISVPAYRLVAFVVAGLYAGLAGALLPPLENTVTPPVAHWSTSAEPILATLLGGIYTFAGPIVGAALLVLLKDVIVRVTVHWSIVLGAAVIVLVMGFRGGVASIVAGRVRARPR
ncbi:MAG: branched-chain amino acid ABC transporter permease [Armatimonadota bacterium]|nr:branched-chain amino acid ABC transporter permease [Armatimonadota bacterium]